MMKKVIVHLTFPEELVKEPLIYQAALMYQVVPNIRRARISETAGEVVLELSGEKGNIDKAIQFWTEKGVAVENVPGDVMEG